MQNAAAAQVTGRHACACGGFVAVDAAGRETRTGCTATTTRQFAPGHDAKLKGFLIRAGREGLHIRTPEGGAEQLAANVADRFGFGQMVRDGIARRGGKTHRVAAKPAPRKVTAKVGRWVYEGVLSERGSWFTYTDKKGVTRNTKKFTVQEG